MPHGVFPAQMYFNFFSPSPLKAHVAIATQPLHRLQIRPIVHN